MNKRIRKKIYKRAHKKLESYKAPADHRSYFKIAKEEHVLSDLERRVFLSEEKKWIKFTDSILEEIKVEENKLKRGVRRNAV